MGSDQIFQAIASSNVSYSCEETVSARNRWGAPKSPSCQRYYWSPKDVTNIEWGNEKRCGQESRKLTLTSEPSNVRGLMTVFAWCFSCSRLEQTVTLLSFLSSMSTYHPAEKEGQLNEPFPGIFYIDSERAMLPGMRILRAMTVIKGKNGGLSVINSIRWALN